MSDVPDGLTLKRNRDLVGLERHPVTRWILLGLVSIVLVLALVNVFGQHPTTVTGESAAASLSVYAPERVRGGLLYMARMRVDARTNIENATLVLDSGWLEELQINTIEPAPVEESSVDGNLALEFGALPAGEELVVYFEIQVNPTNVGYRSQDVGLYDGDRLLLRVDRSILVYP